MIQKSQTKSLNQKIDYSKIYSPSKLDMFTKCPKSYHFYYLDPIYSQMKNDLKRQPSNIWKFHTLGKAVHNAITLFYYLSPELRTEEALLEQLKKAWVSEIRWNQKPPLGKWGGFKTVEEERNSYRAAILMLKNFFEIADINPNIEYLPKEDFRRSIEDYISLITPLNEEFNISGKFDLIVKDEKDFLRIIDFKTSKSEKADEFQLRFYKVLAEANFKKPVKKASLFFLKTGNTEKSNLDLRETEEIKDEILEKIKEIKATQRFETKPSKLCKFCLFQTFCPERGEVTEIIKKVSEEEYQDDLPF